MKIIISYSPRHHVSAGVLPIFSQTLWSAWNHVFRWLFIYLPIFHFFISLLPPASLSFFPCLRHHASSLLSSISCMLPFLVILTFLFFPSHTLIRQRRYGSALWDWRKEGLILYLSMHVFVCLCVYVCTHMSSFVNACLHTPLLVWNMEILAWMYKRIQWRGVEFLFLSPQEEDTAAKRREGKLAFLFSAVHPLPKHTVTSTQPCWRKSVNDVWSSHLR